MFADGTHRADATCSRVRLHVADAAERARTMDGRFSRIERKLDQFVDTQSKANELVERHLQALEPPSAT